MINILASIEGAEPVVIEAMFPTTARRLFAAWTEPDQVRQWFGLDPTMLTDVRIDLREGGHWRFVMRAGRDREEYLEGQYLEILPEERLTFSWSHHVKTAEGQHDQTPPSQVSIRFEPHGKATRMTLEHKAISTEGGRLGVRKGWIASFESLAKAVAAKV